jgi:ADP-ribose pyrophosphatase
MIKTLNKKLIYENKWIRLWEDEVEFPNGEQGIYSYVQRIDEGGLIIPMIDDTHVVLLREWRYPIQSWTWCWPAGGSHTPGEAKLIVAQRELVEETGYTATDWTDLGTIQIDPGLNAQTEQVYLARGLTAGTPQLDVSEIHEVVIKSFDEVEQMISSGEINNGWFLAGWAKLKVFLSTRELTLE